MHGLTATRRYVTMGSRLLERRGYRVVAYDARGHGESSAPTDPSAYGYEELVADLAAVLEALGLVERVALAGSSMGAATALAYALKWPARVAALVLSTPGHAGRPHDRPEDLAAWEALADGLEHDGVDGFMRAFHDRAAGRWREGVRRLTRQRLERHANPAAVADALRVVPRAVAFDGLEALGAVTAPALVVGSRDEADPDHPLALARAYARALPAAELIVEEPGRAPLAWRGAQVSRAIADFLARRAPDFAAAAPAS